MLTQTHTHTHTHTKTHTHTHTHTHLHTHTHTHTHTQIYIYIVINYIGTHKVIIIILIYVQLYTAASCIAMVACLVATDIAYLYYGKADRFLTPVVWSMHRLTWKRINGAIQ